MLLRLATQINGSWLQPPRSLRQSPTTEDHQAHWYTNWGCPIKKVTKCAWPTFTQRCAVQGLQLSALCPGLSCCPCAKHVVWWLGVVHAAMPGGYGLFWPVVSGLLPTVLAPVCHGGSAGCRGDLPRLLLLLQVYKRCDVW